MSNDDDKYVVTHLTSVNTQYLCYVQLQLDEECQFIEENVSYWPELGRMQVNWTTEIKPDTEIMLKQKQCQYLTNDWLC